MKKLKLIQAVLITISIAILLGLFVKMQTIQPRDIDYDSDPYSKIQYIDDIRKVINTIKGDSEKKIASLVKYPLAMSYPVPDINNEEEFIERFDEVFDEAILEKIASSSTDDWNTVGWRGIMFDNGMVWLEYDGLIKAVNYQSEKEKQIQKELIEKERTTLHISVQEFMQPLHHVYIDNDIVRVDKMPDDSFRLVIWKDKDATQLPDLVISNGVIEFHGSGGGASYLFKDNNYTYDFGDPYIGSKADPAIPYLEIYEGDNLIYRGYSH